MPDLSGQQLAHYRLIRKIGRGNFAEVYLGRDENLDIQVAVKVLSTTPLDLADVENLREEARIVADLKHPHIVRVYQCDVENNIAFLVMDYAPNGTLRQAHPKGTRIPLAMVMTYFRQIADALDYLHRKKLIHCDVKPENMLLDWDGSLLLSDFGITILSPSVLMSQQPQAIFGTPLYVAPEQLKGQPSRASDQYALGIVLYEWLSGACPFNGNEQQLWDQHLHAAPPSLRGKMLIQSEEVEQVVMKALAKNPRERFASVREFAFALEEAYKRILDFHGSDTSSAKTKEQWLKDGRELRIKREYEKAIEAYSRVIEIDIECIEAYNNRGTMHKKLGDALAKKEYRQAIADYDHALALDPTLATVYNNRGNAYFALDEYEQAIADYSRAIELNGRLAIAYNSRGYAYARLGQYRRAIEDYNAALQCDANHPTARTNREQAYRLLKEQH